MKLSEYYTKTPENRANRDKTPQIMLYNDEAKEAKMTAKMAYLESKIADLEGREEEKSILLGQFQNKEAENTELLTSIASFKDKIDTLEAQTHDKQRVIDENSTLLRTNDQLLVAQGEMTSRLAELSTEYTNQTHELAQMRVNNADLEVAKQSLYNEALNKDTLMQEMGNALSDLKEQHEGLSSFSDELNKKFTEVSEARDSLDKLTVKLTGDLLIAKQHQENSITQAKYDKAQVEQAVETRIRGIVDKQITELSQDVDDLTKINTFYKNELSKPQHLSIGAIARQENFRIPLASSAVNYRKNNLGTGKPTLLKFGAKENSS